MATLTALGFDRTEVVPRLVGSADTLLMPGGLVKTRPHRGFVNAAGSATLVNLGMAGSASGTVAAVLDADGPWLSLTTAAAAGSVALASSTSTGVTRPDALFSAEYVVESGSDITSVRWYICLGSVAPSDAADPALIGVGVRFSTVDGDAGFNPFTSAGGGSTTFLGAINTIVARTVYRIRIRAITSTTFGISINGGTESVATLTVPGPTQSLGIHGRLYTQVAGARAFLFREVFMVSGT